jgi:hypothetical protein
MRIYIIANDGITLCPEMPTARDQRCHNRAVEPGVARGWNSRLQYTGDFDTLAEALSAIAAAYPAKAIPQPAAPQVSSSQACMISI